MTPASTTTRWLLLTAALTQIAASAGYASIILTRHDPFAAALTLPPLLFALAMSWGAVCTESREAPTAIAGLSAVTIPLAILVVFSAAYAHSGGVSGSNRNPDAASYPVIFALFIGLPLAAMAGLLLSSLRSAFVPWRAAVVLGSGLSVLFFSAVTWAAALLGVTPLVALGAAAVIGSGTLLATNNRL